MVASMQHYTSSQSPAHLYNGVYRGLLDLSQWLFLTQVRGHKAEATEELVCVSAGWNTGWVCRHTQIQTYLERQQGHSLSMNGNTQLIPSEQYELTGCTMRQDPRALGKQVLLLQFTLICFCTLAVLAGHRLLCKNSFQLAVYHIVYATWKQTPTMILPAII